MDWQTVRPIQNGWRIPLLLLHFIFRVRRTASTLVVVRDTAGLLDIVLADMMTVVDVRVLSTWREKLAALLICGASRVDDMRALLVHCMRAMVQMTMVVLLRNLVIG